MLDVCLLGTGGMMPLPYRWLTSCMMRMNGSNLLIDCGEGTQVALKEKGWGFKSIDILCITHFHADHISGLPGLLLAMGNSERTEPLLMIGPKGLERVVNSLRVIAPELPFAIRFIELTEDQETHTVNDYEINAFKVHHNMTCYGYNVQIHRQGRFDAERAKSQNIPLKFWSRLQKGEIMTDEAGNVFTPEMVLGPDRKGLSITYCTDTRPTREIEYWATDADLFICEGMYGDRDKTKDAKAKKHMMMHEAAEIAARANPKEMWYTHYSPAMNYPVNYEADMKQIFPNLVISKDGQSKTFAFSDEEQA